MVSPDSDGGLRLELTGTKTTWIVGLPRADCEAIAEAIGYRRPGYFTPQLDSDS